MIRIQQLKLPVSHTEEELIQKIAKMLGIRPRQFWNTGFENSLWTPAGKNRCLMSIRQM